MASILDPIFGCLRVTSRLDREGYAFWGKTRAHIHAWTSAHGPVGVDKDGAQLELDHLCRRRNCIALHHLEPVTRSENEKRKSFRYRVKRATCPKGHALNENRVATPEGGFVCRACNQDANRQGELTWQT